MMKDLNYVPNRTGDKLQCYWKENCFLKIYFNSLHTYIFQIVLQLQLTMRMTILQGQVVLGKVMLHIEIF